MGCHILLQLLVSVSSLGFQNIVTFFQFISSSSSQGRTSSTSKDEVHLLLDDEVPLLLKDEVHQLLEDEDHLLLKDELLNELLLLCLHLGQCSVLGGEPEN